MNKSRVIQSSLSIIEALKKMDEERVKSLLVFSDDKFLSLLTIGDIQRAIISDCDLNMNIEHILDIHNKKYCSAQDPIEIIKAKMLELRAECMPVISLEGKLEKVYYWEDLFLSQTVDQEREKINLPVVIMAGGKGTRLKPLTNVIPKPLIPIGEKTILETIMDQFETIGCNQFYMSVNYKYDILEFYLNQLVRKYNIRFFKEDKPLGTIGSVSLLKDKIKTPFFLSNCDIIIDQDFRDVYEYHRANRNDITLITSLKSFQIPYGVIETAKDGIMTGLSEKPEYTYMINTGVYLLEPGLIKEIPENELFHITDLIEKIKNKGGKVGCFPVSEKSWTDIGEWNGYLKLINV